VQPAAHRTGGVRHGVTGKRLPVSYATVRRSRSEGEAEIGKHVKWIEHRSQRILYSDYSGLKGADYEAAVDETLAELLKIPDGTSAPSITNIKGTTMSPATAAKGREVAELVNKKRLKGPTVVVGASALAGSVISLMQADIHVAKTPEEAKQWVVDHPA
jgi:hypothetical protein